MAFTSGVNNSNGINEDAGDGLLVGGGLLVGLGGQFLVFRHALALLGHPAQLRLGIGPAPASIGLAVLVTALLGWLAWQLGREPVRAARAARHLKPWSLTPPALVGVALVVGLGVVVAVLRGGEAAAHARELAAQQVTPDYRLHVRSVSKTRSGQGTRITATVTAWTDSDIKTVPVQWQQP